MPLKKISKLTALASATLIFSAATHANILTSVKPLGFIASSVANGVTDTDVLVPAGASPHDYSLKPSDVEKLKKADIVLWIGEDVDAFLEKSLTNLDYKRVLTISDFTEIEPFLGKSAHHHHDEHEHVHNHEHENHEHEHAEAEKLETNWHIWTSPEISKAVAQRLAQKLIKQYPEKQALIEQNLASFQRTLDEQNAKIKTQLIPFKDKGFFVFHDAYGYFNDAYGLKQMGAFTINPLVTPGAKTLAHIKEEIEEHRVNCLFAEPQFTPKVIESLAKGTRVNVGQLDPLGDKIALGSGSYVAFLQSLADSYTQCLAK